MQSQIDALFKEINRIDKKLDLFGKMIRVLINGDVIMNKMNNINVTDIVIGEAKDIDKMPLEENFVSSTKDKTNYNEFSIEKPLRSCVNQSNSDINTNPEELKNIKCDTNDMDKDTNKTLPTLLSNLTTAESDQNLDEPNSEKEISLSEGKDP